LPSAALAAITERLVDGYHSISVLYSEHAIR